MEETKGFTTYHKPKRDVRFYDASTLNDLIKLLEEIKDTDEAKGEMLVREFRVHIVTTSNHLEVNGAQSTEEGYGN